jgi:hypothetical protein
MKGHSLSFLTVVQTILTTPLDIVRFFKIKKKPGGLKPQALKSGVLYICPLMLSTFFYGLQFL